MSAFAKIAETVSKEAEGEEERRLYTIGRWHMSLGWLRSHILDLEDARDYSFAVKDIEFEMVYQLRDIATGAAIMLCRLDIDDPAAAFISEYERAAAKHPGMTLDSDKHSDESRYYALAEEVGEVCAALTYDNKAATGHNSDLISEVTQVGALAIAWLVRFEEDKQK